MGQLTWGSDKVATIHKALDDFRQDGNCLKRTVGSVIIDTDGTVVAGAANGTPDGMRRCDAGGCIRCAASGQFPHGVGYDLCVCVHAEQGALLSALRFGIKVAGLFIATSYQPCFMCAKLIVAAGFSGVLYGEPWQVPEEQAKLPGLRADYAALWERLPHGCVPLASPH